MHLDVNADCERDPLPTAAIPFPKARLFLPITHIGITCGLLLVALISRLVLASQLDLVTDEVIYIPTGQTYWSLLKQFNMLSNGWSMNYEHPPFAKVLIGMALWLNTAIGHPMSDLLAARMPSILFGSLLIIAVYRLGRAPFGNVVALLGAFGLAVSPWLVYFSSLAYLDMTMTTLVATAYLFLWHALRQPRYYLLSALLIGLAIDSKYTALLTLPGMFLFPAYYFLAIRPGLSSEQRPPIPWFWWLAALLLIPLTFLIADPALWPQPYILLRHSLSFEWHHAQNGHLTFLAGLARFHVPRWAALYTVITKLSAFVTIPAALFTIITAIHLLRFHLVDATARGTEGASKAFLFIWLLTTVGGFSLLDIEVGTHYYLPLIPPVMLAGAYGLTLLFGYRRGSLFAFSSLPSTKTIPIDLTSKPTRRTDIRATLVVAFLTIVFVGPQLYGLITVHAVEGYTSEFFHGEDTVLQVAYPDYREALNWLSEHTHGSIRVGLVALPGTIIGAGNGTSWYNYNQDLAKRFQVTEAHVDDKNFPYDYLIWPMHLVQRGYAIPPAWRTHVVYTEMGGDTVYCYITGRPTTIIHEISQVREDPNNGTI